MPCLISVVLDTEDMVLLVLGLRIRVSAVVVAACIPANDTYAPLHRYWQRDSGEMGRGSRCISGHTGYLHLLLLQEWSGTKEMVSLSTTASGCMLASMQYMA